MGEFNKQAVADSISIQQISSSPILAIAASFWEPNRIEAFKICYQSMRATDNLVDDLKVGSGKVPVVLRRKIKRKVADWLECLDKKTPIDEIQKNLLVTMSEFNIPSWPWHKLAEAMIYDLDHNGYATFADFLLYTEGAAVSPGAIFMHLCGVQKVDGDYLTPDYFIDKTARPLARFSYLVHIIRDFQEDQQEGLNYFADDILRENNLSIKQLRKIAKQGQATDDFRHLISQYQKLAEGFRMQSRQMIDCRKSEMASRYLLSLELIYQLYLQIFERIDLTNGNFTTVEMNPTPEEIRERMLSTVASF